jgi:hypothetical protein
LRTGHGLASRPLLALTDFVNRNAKAPLDAGLSFFGRPISQPSCDFEASSNGENGVIR